MRPRVLWSVAATGLGGRRRDDLVRNVGNDGGDIFAQKCRTDSDTASHDSQDQRIFGGGGAAFVADEEFDELGHVNYPNFEPNSGHFQNEGIGLAASALRSVGRLESTQP